MENGGNKKRGISMAVLGGIFWGFSGACGQFLFTHTDVSVRLLACVRVLLAGIILVAAGFLKDREKTTGIWKDPRSVGKLFLFALCGVMVCQYAYLMAISCSNAGTATVLQYLAPVMIMGVLCVYRRKPPTIRETAALILALTGVFLLATHGDPGTLALSRRALFWGLSAAVGMVLYSLLPGSLTQKWGSMTVTGWALLIAGIATGILTQVWNERMTLTVPAVLGVGGVTVIGTVLAYTMYLQGVADIGADHASMLACVEPVAAAVFASLWLGTEFLTADVFGFAAILLSVIVLTVRKKKRI